MATAEEKGGFTANANPPPYGGGGAGGKFPRKALRRQAGPYDRPPTALRGNNKPGGFLTKIFVDPALKLMSYGMGRFLAPVFRKRLPAPAPTRQLDVNHYTSDATQAALLNEGQKVDGECSHQSNGALCNGVSDLEQLLKENTFTRPEIVRLTELLQYKAAEISSDDPVKDRVETASDVGKHQWLSPFTGCENRDQEIQLSASVPSPSHQIEFPEDEIASPAEIAKAYMGARTLKASTSALGVPHVISRQGTGFPNNGAFISKSPAMPSNKKNSVRFPTFEDGFVSLRSGGRSSVARTLYSRDSSVVKAFGKSRNGVPPSSSPYSVENSGNFSSQSTNLKRRISVLDDDIASVAPVRRIRQKSYLLATPHAPYRRLGSHSKQNPETMGAPTIMITRNGGESENHATPSTSYARYTPKSSEVAAKILQQLEKLSPKEISSEPKAHVGFEKSKLQLKDIMLSRQALRSMENVDSLILHSDMQDDKRIEEKPWKPLPKSQDSLEKPENEENGSLEHFFSLETQNSKINIALALNSDISPIGTIPADSIIGIETLDSSQKTKAFRMSAQEDFLEVDDDVPGPSSELSLGKPEIVEPSTTVCKVLPSNETGPTVTKIESALVPPVGLAASKEHEIGTPCAAVFRDERLVAFPELGELIPAAHSEASLSFGEIKEVNCPTQLFSFSSKVDDTFCPDTEANQKSASSFGKLEAEDISQFTPAKGEANETLSAQSPLLCCAVSSSEKEKSTDSASLFPSSTSAVKTVSSSMSALLSGNVSDPGTKPSIVLFPTAVSPHPTTTTSVTSGFIPKAEIHHSSTLSLPAMGTASSGNITSGLSSSFSPPTLATLQGSLFGNPFKNLASGAGINISSSCSVASSASASVMFAASSGNYQSSCATKSDASAAPINETAVNFAVSSSSANVTGSGTAGAEQNFNFESTSSMTESGIVKNAPTFSFGTGSSSLASVNPSGSSSNTSSIVFGGFGWSSVASSSAINSVSSSSVSSNVFGSSWQSSSSPLFSTAFPSFGSSSTPSAPLNSTGSVFGSSVSAPSSSLFSFTTTPGFVASSSSLPLSQPVFGKSMTSGFTSSPGNNDQMNAEDSMAEDPVQSSAPAFPVFGQPSPPISTSISPFGSAASSQANPFFSFGQPNQVPPQGSGSLEFNTSGGGGGFSLGSGGPDKSRRTVRISKVRNRKKP